MKEEIGNNLNNCSVEQACCHGYRHHLLSITRISFEAIWKRPKGCSCLPLLSTVDKKYVCMPQLKAPGTQASF